MNRCYDIRQTWRRFVLLLPAAWLLIGIALTSMGCFGSGDRAVTFAVGGAPAELDFWEGLIGDFEATTGIRVHVLRQPTDTDQRRQSLVISFAARRPEPDLFLMDIVWVAQFAASGWLEPLDQYLQFDNNAGLAPDDFFPNVLNLADRYHAELIALPVYVDGGLLYYRRDILGAMGVSTPPQTWDRLVDDCLAAQDFTRQTDRSFFGFLWQGAQYEGLVCNFLEFAESNGGGIVLSDGKIALHTPANIAAGQFMVDLIHKWGVSPPSTYIEMKEEEVRAGFQQGDALFERNWPYAWNLHQAADSRVRGKTGIAPLPHFPGGRSVSTLGGWHIGISKYSRNKELSWRLLKFLLSYETQKKLAVGLGWPPARRDVYSDPFIRAHLHYLVQLEKVFENARPRPALPYYTQLSEVLQRYLNAMLAGAMTPDAALASAERDAQRIVDRYGKD